MVIHEHGPAAGSAAHFAGHCLRRSTRRLPRGITARVSPLETPDEEVVTLHVVDISHSGLGGLRPDEDTPWATDTAILIRLEREGKPTRNCTGRIVHRRGFGVFAHYGIAFDEPSNKLI